MALSLTFASLIALVPAVTVASPAQAAPGDLSITDQTGVEGTTFSFLLTYAGIGPATYTVSTAETGDATAGRDYTATPAPTTVSFVGGPDTRTVTVTTLADQLYEDDESFTLQAVSVGNDDNVTATGTIEDDDDVPTFRLSAANTVSEAALADGYRTVRVTATLSAVSGLNSDIGIGTEDGTATAAFPHPDYVPTMEVITIPAGSLSAFVDITIVDDTRNEDEYQSFFVGAFGSENTEPFGEGGEFGVLINIVDDDAVPTVSIGGAGEVLEGSPLGFPLTLSAASEKEVTVQVSTTDGTDTATTVGARSTTDYVALTNFTVTFPAETTAQTVEVQTTTDTVFEASPESLSATLSNPVNAVLGVARTALGSITDDDVAPTVTLAPLTAVEGDAGTTTAQVTATLSGQTDVPVRIDYTINGGTATAGIDYVARTGSVEIPVGSTTVRIPVGIIGDETDEPDETVLITLSTPNMSVNTASLGDQTFTITDDDETPTFTVGDVSVVEGNAAGVKQIPVTLSNPSSQDIDLVITSGDGADSAENDGMAVGSKDYDSPAGTLKIAAGETVGYIDVTVNGDSVFEESETASITAELAPTEDAASDAQPGTTQHTATLTLRNDDAAPVLTFFNSTGAEGTTLRLVGTVVGSAQDPIFLNLTYETVGPDAAEPADFTGSQDFAIITPGATAVPLADVLLNDDTIDEPVETFFVVASEGFPFTKGADAKATKAAQAKAAKAAKAKAAKAAKADSANAAAAPDIYTFQTAQGTYKITDDPGDLPPTASISDETIVENEGSVDLTVSLTFTGTTTATEQIFTVPYSTADGTAVSTQDYVSKTGTLSISPGVLSGIINVGITNDTLFEPDETFLVRLGTPGPAGATVSKAVGEVTIESDDDANRPTLIAPASIRGAGLVVVSGVASPNATVELMLGKFGTTTPLIKRKEIVADSSGRYSFAEIIAAPTRFGVRSNGLLSDEKSVRIQQLPVLSASSGTRGTVTLVVQGNPRGVGQTVYLQRLSSSGKWATLTQGTTTGTNKYTRTLSGYKSGTTWSFRAYVVGSIPQGTLSGYSTAKRLRIR